MSTSLAIFVAVAATGCVFLIYFLCALWRDAGSSKHRGRVRITTLPVLSARRGKLLRLYSAEEFARTELALSEVRRVYAGPALGSSYSFIFRLVHRLCRILRSPEVRTMSIESIIMLAISTATSVYLVYALLRPEKF